MFAEIITIGDEILIGQIVDTNSTYISKALNKIGVSVYQITSVQDDREQILEALKTAQQHADIVIITGGLGPTKDDITKTTLAEYFDDTLVQSDAVLKNIEHLWEKYIKKPLSQLNIDQALIPSKSVALMNYYGSAPGMWFENNGKVVVSLPGVPYEMKALMENQVIPKLQKTYNFPYIIHKTLLTHGLGESALVERIEVWEDRLPKFIKLAYLPNLGRVRLRLTGKLTDKDKLLNEIDNQIKILLPQIEDIFVGYEDDETIESLIGKLLIAHGKTLATAESCTGGKIAEAITSIPGASNYFKGSIVSYATEAKINLLHVSEDLIEEFSVVSTQVAEAMAANAQKIFNVDYAIATTGNAGPDKGDSTADVGTVCIAIATKNRVYAEEFQLGNHRIKVINKAVNKAFEMLQKEILKK
jgi:nicotinamide-nucleotide amidase